MHFRTVNFDKFLLLFGFATQIMFNIIISFPKPRQTKLKVLKLDIIIWIFLRLSHSSFFKRSIPYLSLFIQLSLLCRLINIVSCIFLTCPTQYSFRWKWFSFLIIRFLYLFFLRFLYSFRIYRRLRCLVLVSLIKFHFCLRLEFGVLLFFLNITFGLKVCIWIC